MPTPARSSRRTSSAQLVLGCLAALVLGAAFAQDDVEREGYFEVRSASTQIENGVHTLDARLQLVLSSEALAALESSVTLTIEMQMQVIRVRRWLPDDVDAELDVNHATPEVGAVEVPELAIAEIRREVLGRRPPHAQRDASDRFGQLAGAVVENPERIPVFRCGLQSGGDGRRTVRLASSIDRAPWSQRTT